MRLLVDKIWVDEVDKDLMIEVSDPDRPASGTIRVTYEGLLDAGWKLKRRVSSVSNAS